MSKSNFITINSTFKPLTYEQVMKPLEAATKSHLEAQAVYDKISAQATDVLSMLNPDTDQEQIDQYKQFMQQIQGGVDDLNKNGYNIGTLNNLSKIYRGYGEVINPIEKAYQRRAEIAKTQFDAKQKDQSYYPQFDASTTPLGKFINNPSLLPKSFSGAAITKDVEDTMKNFSKLYNEGASNVDFTQKEGKILKGLFTTGLTQEDVIDMMSGIQDPNNHDYDNILRIINDAVNKTGVNEWNNPKAYKSAVESALRGLYGGLGTSSLQALTSGNDKNSSNNKKDDNSPLLSAINMITKPATAVQEGIVNANKNRIEADKLNIENIDAYQYPDELIPDAQEIVDSDTYSKEDKIIANNFLRAAGVHGGSSTSFESADDAQKAINDYIRHYNKRHPDSKIAEISKEEIDKIKNDRRNEEFKKIIRKHPETGINPNDEDAPAQYLAYQYRSTSIVPQIELNEIETSQPVDDKLMEDVRGLLTGYINDNDRVKKQKLVDANGKVLDDKKFNELMRSSQNKISWDPVEECLTIVDAVGNRYYFGEGKDNWKSLFNDVLVILPYIDENGNMPNASAFTQYGVSSALDSVSKYAKNKLSEARRNTYTIDNNEVGENKYFSRAYKDTISAITASYINMMEIIMKALIGENNNFIQNKSKSSEKSDKQGGVANEPNRQ